MIQKKDIVDQSLARATHLLVAPLLVMLSISACGTTPAAPQPTAFATNAPVATTLPTTQPTAAPPLVAEQPTAQLPAPTAVAETLPAPLYFIDGTSGQIMQIGRDGTTLRQITNETQTINSFAVSPANGTLVYAVGDWQSEKRAIVYLNAQGEGRTELVSGPVSAPIFSPSGEISFETTAPTAGWEIGKDTSAPGVWSTTPRGGRPSRVIENDPVSDMDNPPEGARSFHPVAWSPDASSLLLLVTPNRGNRPAGDVSGRGMAVLHRGGELIEIAKLGEQPRACVEATWSRDSASVLCSNSYQLPNSPALWRANAQTGAAEELIKGEEGGNVSLVARAQQINDDSLMLFRAQGAAYAASEFTLQQLHLDGSVPAELNSAALDFGAASSAAWAPDHSGAAVLVNTASRQALRWVPANGDAPTTLPGNGYGPQWGK